MGAKRRPEDWPASASAAGAAAISFSSWSTCDAHPVGHEHGRALVAEAVSISRATTAKIRQNLFWAFAYNAAGIPLAALGYPATVPIIPPGASVSPRSTLAKRIDTPSDGRGKSPGIRHRDGLWSGFDWLPYRADARDYERWHDMGAGTGIKTGAESGVVVLDADTENEEYAGVIKGVIERVCGLSPVRIGKYPKALYVFRTEAGGVVPQYRRVEFGKVNGKGVPERVELLSDGRQFVAAGVHNRTGLPYRWARALCAWGDQAETNFLIGMLLQAWSTGVTFQTPRGV